MKNPKRTIFLRSLSLVGRDLASRRAGRTSLLMQWLLHSLASALAALALAPLAPAQTPPITSGPHVFADSTTFDAPARQQFTAALTPTWLIADGATVTIANVITTANGGVFEMNTNNATVFTIAPSGSTGRVVFRNNITSGEGGVFYQNRNTLDITNASFIDNGSTKTSAHGGGALRIGSTAIATSLTNVLFDKNYALSLGGAIRTLHGLSITSGTFTGNYAAGVGTANTIGYGGAIAAYAGGLNTNANGVQQSVVRESYFAGNWASRYGGAIGLDTLGYHSFNFFDHAGFADNFAGVAGGAFYDYANTALLYGNAPIIDGQRFVFTGTNGTTNYVYSGNIARGVAMTEDEIARSRAGSFAFTATAAAKAGGFYFSGTASTRLRFDIAEGVTVAIGAAGNPSAWDSIANSDASGTTARIDLVETGTAPAPGGTLVLHADNSYFQGDVNVDKGALLLGNQNAKLGGLITVASGATFGGAGELITHKQNDTVFAGRTQLVLGDNAFLQVGADTAIDAETLTIAGDLLAGNGVTITHDLFSSGSASLLRVENFTFGDAASTVTINLGLLATGTFTLIEWSGAGIGASDMERLALTVDGMADNPRNSASLFLSGSQLFVTSTVNNLIMRWSGAGGDIWTYRTSGAQRNWADAGGSAQDRFYNADTVVFDGVADAAHAGNRDITIDTGGVIVSGMEVSGTASYMFRGAGGIRVDASTAASAPFTPTGNLQKSGAGELVFANTAPNFFQGGIEISGGVIAFNNGAQLATGASGIAFLDSGTLRAAGDVAGALASNMNISAGKTAVLEVEQDGSLVFSGTLASAADATLRKTGEGTLLVAGNSSTNAGAFAIDAGATLLANTTAALGGKITVGAGATLGGIGSAGQGGSVKIASGGILEAGLDRAQPGTLTVHNLEMTGGAILRMDLFADADGVFQKNDRILDTGVFSISGANTIDLTSFASGTFNLGNLTGLAAAGRVTLSGMTLLAGGRLSAALTNNGGVLELVTTSDQSRVMTWTGNGSTWNLAQSNWTDGGSVNQYSYGDRVLFDGSAPAAVREILIGGDEVRVADMTVSGNADYTFTGGGIHADAGNVQHNGITDATGKLVKTGDGTLTFANGKNTFLGGIEIDGGTLVFRRGDQLTTADDTGITFTGNSALRAAADLTLGDAVSVETGITGVIDSAGHTLTLLGAIDGASDATLAKAGYGTLVLGADASGFSGTFAVREGVLRAGAADVFAAAAGSVISISSGATLDLDGHNQTLARLQGPGAVELGTAALTMNIGAGGAEFAGGFAGSGTVIKQGAGKWTLSGSSSHTGGILWQAGGIGLASDTALGAGALTVAMPAARLELEADGLAVANAIAAGSGTLTIETNGRDAEFSGNITAGSLVLEGAGTLALSGNNTTASLAINTPLAIAHRAESISGNVRIATGSTLEFRGVATGQVSSNLSGDRVLFTSSTMFLSGTNTLRTLDIAARSRVTAASAGALGGINAGVTVRDGAQLVLPGQATLAGDMDVNGGALVFGAGQGRMGSLALSGSLGFSNGGEVRLDGLLPTGIYTAAVAYGGITNMPAYDPHQGGMFMVADIIDGDTLLITAYNKALEPGKDIIVAFDTLASMTRAVNARLGEEFLVPLAGEDGQRPGQHRKSSMWFRGIGSYMEYGADGERFGYTDKTWMGIIGYDIVTTKNLMLGGFFGVSNTRLETSNDASTRMDMPWMGLYAARRMGDFFATADVTAGFGTADTERREDFGNIVTGSHKLNGYGGSLGVGYLLPLFSNGVVRPSVGIHYMRLGFLDYSETGQGAVRLDNMRASMLQGVVRIDTSKNITLPWGLLGMVDLTLGWRQNLASKQTTAWATLVAYPDARLQIRGDNYASNSLMTGIGVRMMLTKSMLFSLAYDYDTTSFGDQNNSTGRHTFNAMIRKTW